MRTLILTIGLLLMPSTLFAQSKVDAQRKAASREAWKKGITAYNQGNYDRAIDRFEAAYAINPSPNILFNLGQAYRKRGDVPKALENLQSYLEKKPDAPNRALVEELIQELERSRPPTVAPPAEPPPPPIPTPVLATPDVTGEQAVAREAESRPWYSDRVAIALGSAGLVTSAVGIGLLVHSGSLADEAVSTVDESDAIDRNQSAKRFRLAGGIVTAVGAAAIAAGIVKLLLHDDARPERAISWSAGPRSVSVTVTFD